MNCYLILLGVDVIQPITICDICLDKSIYPRPDWLIEKSESGGVVEYGLPSIGYNSIEFGYSPCCSMTIVARLRYYTRFWPAAHRLQHSIKVSSDSSSIATQQQGEP